MNRKFLTTLLCLLLVAMLPITALAAVTERSINITVDTENYADVSALSDLLDVMTVKVISGDQEGHSGAMVLNLGGTDVLTIAARVDLTGVFVQTDALDDNLLYFSWDDLIALLQQTDGLSAADNEMLGTIRQFLQNMRDGNMPIELEQLTQKLYAVVEVLQEDEELFALMAGVIDDAKITEGIFESEKHDTADQKIECMLTPEFYIKSVETKTSRAVLEAALTIMDDTYTDEVLSHMVNEIIRLAQENYADDGRNLDMTLLMAQGELVSFSGLATMNSSQNTIEQINIIYHRLTTAQSVNHSVEVSNDEMALVFEVAQNADGSFVAACHAVEDDSLVTFQFDLMENTEDSIKAACHVSDGISQVTFQYDMIRADEVKDHTFSMYFIENTEGIMRSSASQRPIYSLHVVSKTMESTVLDGVNNATIDTATVPLQFPVVEFKEFQENAGISMQRALMRLMSYLPTSTLQEITGE